MGSQILHHTLGDKKYDHFLNMSAQVSCAATVILDASKAAEEIDKTLNAMLYYSQPVYIGVPVDIAATKISSTSLKTRLVKELPPNDPATESSVVNEVISRIKASKSPIIISDGGAIRHQVTGEVAELIAVTKFPTFVTGMGKSSVDEQNPSFGGVYIGAATKPDVKKVIESSDCVLWIGNYPSDFNTGEFSEHVDAAVTIDFQRFYIMIGEKRYEGNIKHILRALIIGLKSQAITSKLDKIPCTPYPSFEVSKAKEIKHEWIWQRFSTFIKPGDFIIPETGCAQSGITETYLPSGVSMFTQSVFGSIGFATGAAVGASIAAKESQVPFKRLILITGDGSLQLTIQAFSILARSGLSPIIFVLNNKGYTVERLIHGLHADYNNIPNWDYVTMLKAFAPEIESKSHKVSTATELDTLLSNEAFNNANFAQLVDVEMDPFDCPAGIKVIGASADKNNAG